METRRTDHIDRAVLEIDTFKNVVRRGIATRYFQVETIVGSGGSRQLHDNGSAGGDLSCHLLPNGKLAVNLRHHIVLHVLRGMGEGERSVEGGEMLTAHLHRGIEAKIIVG